jgi:hypothetical protein
MSNERSLVTVSYSGYVLCTLLIDYTRHDSLYTVDTNSNDSVFYFCCYAGLYPCVLLVKLVQTFLHPLSDLLISLLIA